MSGRHQLIRIDTGRVDVSPSKVKPRVGVLMSTFNGAKYLIDQVDSIAAQEGVTIEMFVRDDGSSDGTQDLIDEISHSSLGCIDEWHVKYGSNLGYLASFDSLLSVANGCDWYAFSDQDDVWLPSKLESAIEAMSDTIGSALYASSVVMVDERLMPVGKNNFSDFVYSIPSELIRHRLAGHTMIWNRALQCKLDEYIMLPCWSHDQRIVMVALLDCAPLFLDAESYVLHRRLSSSVTPGGAGFCKRAYHEMRMLWNPGHDCDRAALARAILRLPDVEIDVSERRFLFACAGRRRFSLVCDPFFDCGLAAGNIEGQLSVLLGRF